MSDAHRESIRVRLQQPSLRKYRVPVYRELASRPGLALRVLYGDQIDTGGAEPDGFHGEQVHLRTISLFRRTIMWHSPQWRCAIRADTDVLILSWNLHYASLIPALLRARANNVPTILWGHGYSKQEAGWRAWPREKVAGLATALMFYNHTAANRYIERGWDPQRIFVALNALDQTPIQATRSHWLAHPEELAAFRREHRLDAGPVILFVSRFEPANRVDLLIRATAQLRSQHPTLQTIIIGKGEPEETRLKELATSLGVADCVRFPGAIYDEHALAPWFLSANVFCYPANIGLSILHAFGYGLPVVTSDDIASQNPEIEALRDGENGSLYRQGNVDHLVKTLDRLLSEPATTKKMSIAAHQTATQQFTMTNMVDGMETAVRYCANRKLRSAI